MQDQMESVSNSDNALHAAATWLERIGASPAAVVVLCAPSNWRPTARLRVVVGDVERIEGIRVEKDPAVAINLHIDAREPREITTTYYRDARGEIVESHSAPTRDLAEENA